MTPEDERKNESDHSQEIAPNYHSMEKMKLQELAVSAILEHRRLIAADGEVYGEWSRASADPLTTATVLKSLQDEYLARQKKTEAQQDELSEIIDALGFVPAVPVNGEEPG